MNLLLFIAPPAFGKTRWLINAFDEIPTKWLIVSPLRALAEEMVKNFSSYELWNNPQAQWNEWKKSSTGVLVATPEKILEIPEGEWMALKNVLIVWDEWHLIEYWGESFRPNLLEAKWLLMGLDFPIIGLSATLIPKIDCETTVIDYGNFKWINHPHKINFYLSKNHFEDELIKKISLQGPYLHFVKYREEVKSWTQYWNQHQVSNLGCIGGETKQFCEDLKNKKPQIIISTTALSHGVNLPSFKSVFIEGGVSNLSLWIQMVARGGRRGEKFDVHVLLHRYTYKYLNFSSFLMMILSWFIYKVEEFFFGDRRHYFECNSFQRKGHDI